METLYRKKQLLSFFNWYKDDEGELSNNETIVDAYLDSIPETTLTDNAQTLQNALEQIENLEADKAELLEALENTKTAFRYFPERLKEIESLIQKHKQ